MSEKPALSVRRLAGAAAIVSGPLFITGVVFQLTSGWFSEDALQSGAMADWVTQVSAHWSTALLGIGLCVIAIPMWGLVAVALYRVLQPRAPGWRYWG